MDDRDRRSPVVIPNRLHLACRKDISKIPWLMASRKLDRKAELYRAAFSEDICAMSDETILFLRDDVRGPIWTRNIASAEAILRKLK